MEKLQISPLDITYRNLTWEDRVKETLTRSQDVFVHLEGFSSGMIVLCKKWLADEMEKEKIESFESIKQQLVEDASLYVTDYLPLFKIVVCDIIDIFLNHTLTYKLRKDHIEYIKRKTNNYKLSATECRSKLEEFIHRMNSRLNETKWLIEQLKSNCKENDDQRQTLTTLPRKVSTLMYVFNKIPWPRNHNAKDDEDKPKPKDNEDEPYSLLVIEGLIEDLSKSLEDIHHICGFTIEYYQQLCCLEMKNGKRWHFHKSLQDISDVMINNFRNVLVTFLHVTTDVMSINYRQQQNQLQRHQHQLNQQQQQQQQQYHTQGKRSDGMNDDNVADEWEEAEIISLPDINGEENATKHLNPTKVQSENRGNCRRYGNDEANLNMCDSPFFEIYPIWW